MNNQLVFPNRLTIQSDIQNSVVVMPSLTFIIIMVDECMGYTSSARTTTTRADPYYTLLYRMYNFVIILVSVHRQDIESLALHNLNREIYRLRDNESFFVFFFMGGKQTGQNYILWQLSVWVP